MPTKKPENIKNNLICDAGSSCLLIIDIQTRLTAAMPARVLDRLKHNSTILLTAANTLSIPVFTTLQYPQGLGPMEPELQQLIPSSAKCFEKTCFSSYSADGFSQALSDTGRKQIILAGIEAHICVLQTAFSLSGAGYQVFVANDAISSRHRDNYENALQRMQQAGINTSNTESIVYEWLADAKHEQFKTISTLLK